LVEDSPSNRSVVANDVVLKWQKRNDILNEREIKEKSFSIRQITYLGEVDVSFVDDVLLF
jgi:hypothetical protein